MHPALPSGVHLKALETYDVIFSKTGSERLATELFIYRYVGTGVLVRIRTGTLH